MKENVCNCNEIHKGKVNICDCNIIHKEKVDNIKRLLPKEEMYIKTANLFKVLGDKTRIKILWVLREDELCVCDIACLCNMTKSAISHQLTFLKNANIVKCRREGKIVFYSLNDEHIEKIFKMGSEHVYEI